MLETKERPSRETETLSAAELDALEELWTVSIPAGEEPERLGRRLLAAGSRRLGWLIALGWFAFLASAAFQPAADPQAVTPVWAELVIAGLFLSLGTAAIVGLTRSPRVGIAAAGVAGLFGMAISVGCKTTSHHAGGWWLYELGATVTLTALAVAGLRRRQ
jgi:hypothetical protein